MTTLISVAQLAQRHPGFSQASLRWLIFKGVENGLEASGAVIRLGHKVLIDEAKFVEWVRSRATTSAA